MVLINAQFLKIVKDEIQDKINEKVCRFQTINHNVDLIRLDSGDVIGPLAPCVVEAMSRGVSEMQDVNTFQGRGPTDGYSFLKKAIVKFSYNKYKIRLEEDEIFVNAGAKEDLAGIGDILCRDIRVAVIDPVFQTYVESNVIGNRAGELINSQWSHIIYLECNRENDFMPEFPKIRPDVIYLSYPNDPTGCVMSRKTLEKWVKYAIQNEVLILFDASYKSFIKDPEIPQSIYEIKGARKVAIEFHSFSKDAAFTGLHCGYTIIPKDIIGHSISANKSVSLNTLWSRRQNIKNYSPSYVIQRGAEALFTEEGLDYINKTVDYYMSNANLLMKALFDARLKFWGGVNSPYIWVESPYDSSWTLFDKLLNECHILSSPGERFGSNGKGYIRLSSFASQTKVMMAGIRIADMK